MEGLKLVEGANERGNMPALNDTEGQRAMAEVQAAVVMAKRFPRDQKQACDRILLACQRPSLAETAIYDYARGGSTITGPSIRLAETLAQNWGNMQFGIRELEQRAGESTVEAYAWDIETNTRQTKTFQVQHKRNTKKGSYSLEDPRDIYEVVANNGARRLRACILGVLPGDVVDAAVRHCEETLKAKADTSPEAVKKMVETFRGFGITKEHIEKRLQRNLDAITPAQIVGMRKIYNSLKDGMSEASDWFEVGTTQTETAKGVDGLKARLGGNEKHADSKPVPAPAKKKGVEGLKTAVLVPDTAATGLSEFEKTNFDILAAINDAEDITALESIEVEVTKNMGKDSPKILEFVDKKRKELAK